MSEQTLSRSYVIIEGAIGVGKTTLARLLQEHLDTALLLEVFEENPFLSSSTNLAPSMPFRPRCSFY